MSGSTSIVTAENRALGGNNESQDSQQVLDLYQQIYGVGLMSSSPPQGDEPPFPHKSHQPARKQSQGSESRRKRMSLTTLKTRNAIIDDCDFVRSLPSDIYTAAVCSDGELALKADWPSGRPEKASIDRFEEKPQQCAVEVPVALVSDAPNPLVSSAANRKMDDSSQSPTQSNDGRSYERYFRASQRSDKLEAATHLEEPVRAVETLTQSSLHEQKSLSEGDTGAVIFDIDHAVATATAHSLPSDHSPQPPLASVRARTFALQQQTSQEQEQLPETPAVRHNPFAGVNQSHLVPTSQLFRATQFSSAFRRGASPTSSRPSPNDFPHNTISPNPISSPLKARGLRSSPTTGHVSSPQAIHTTDSPQPEDEQAMPFPSASGDDPVVPESPQYRRPRTRPAPAPMDVYVPMRQSQERRSSSIVPQDSGSPELSDDGDDPIDRRRRARSKKEASLKQLTSIKVTRTPKTEDVEVPSTNTKKKNTRTAAQQYLDQCRGSQMEPDQNSESQERVANSQGASSMLGVSRAARHEELTQSSQGQEPGPINNGIANSSVADGEPNPKRRRTQYLLLRIDSTETNVANGETIPETSPVDKAPRYSNGAPGYPSSAVQKPSSNRVVVGSSRNMNDDTSVPKSSVTEYVLPATPSGITDNISGPELPKLVSSNHKPAVSEEQHLPSPNLPQLSSDKPVALPSSPPAPAFSTRNPQLCRDQSYRRGGKLFDGMAFAISFQSKQPGESKEVHAEREKFAESLGAMIVQAGGRVLENGFIELFQSGSSRSVAASPISSMSSSPPQATNGEVNLTAAGRRLGFTALIVDGHSRKAKYMQALALGLPCLAARWITTCLNSGEIVDWVPYLLCAGESTFLGGAYKSRVLTPYNASEARLAQVIEARPRLLEGSRVLLVMKKSEEVNGMAYVFLARVLGATIGRAHSIDEAKAMMKASQEMGQPFDWVYANAGTSSINTGGNSKKRKRAGGNTASTAETLNTLPTLTDELVIQSLILGRLLQEGEI
ncbi:DNA repair protein crb2 [Coniochaeta hoffmannii]|uniref:DNA repair protein crb2 n=1 Tax=Coniochaeta hoffmannii TaxID=91930 RepID=A0AA38RE57_9PEZI|nr:DNA repair protein crb2 [Coniochaeta hoffmannii]